MVNKLIYLLKARKEFDESIDYYEKRSCGLGRRFENQVKQQLENILKHPERYRKQTKYLRESMVKEFPFVIIYRYIK